MPQFLDCGDFVASSNDPSQINKLIRKHVFVVCRSPPIPISRSTENNSSIPSSYHLRIMSRIASRSKLKSTNSECGSIAGKGHRATSSTSTE
jgi:hypothetical protein